jgi:hypothetical protein
LGQRTEGNLKILHETLNSSLVFIEIDIIICSEVLAEKSRLNTFLSKMFYCVIPIISGFNRSSLYTEFKSLEAGPMLATSMNGYRFVTGSGTPSAEGLASVM